MEITEVRVTLRDEDKLKAFANITIDNQIVIRGLKIIAGPLETIPTYSVIDFLQSYFLSEDVEIIVLGFPTNLKNENTDMTSEVNTFRKTLEKKFPNKEVHLQDEKFTSKMAFDAMIAGGMKKKDRRKKENIDRISATIILQSYLDRTIK